MLYHAWVIEHFGGHGDTKLQTTAEPQKTRRKKNTPTPSRSLLDIASGFLTGEMR